MKLSNRILLGLFAFIFLYLTAAFTEIRLKGNPTFMDESNSVAETVDISGVTSLIISDLDKRIYVIGSDRAQLEVRSVSGDLLQKLKYNVSGETLTLSNLDVEKDKPVKVLIHLPKNSLRSIIVNGGSVAVEGLEQKELSVSQNSGRVYISLTHSLEKLHIEANEQADFYISGASLDTLSANLDNSKVIVDSPVKVLAGSIKNSSYLNMSGTEEIIIKKDNSSNLYLY